jgi:nicotianamine synthase
MSVSAAHVTKEVSELYRALVALPSLKPSRPVNRLLTRLVDMCVATPAPIAAAVLRDARVRSIVQPLRRLCSCSESALETYWSERIMAAKDPARELKRFPYYSNYVEMSRIEFRAASAFARQPFKRCLFIGGGPLPLTAIVLAELFGVQVDVLDNDPEAVKRSRHLVCVLGLSRRIRIIQANAFEHTAFAVYDFVMIAALVGKDWKEKRALLARISRYHAGTTVVAMRSACDLKTLLYPPAKEVSVGKFKAQSVMHPLGEQVVNSAVFYRALS